jgi:hypothetical protein
MGSRQAFLLPLFGLVVVSGLTDLNGTAHPAPVPPIRTVLIGNVPPSWKQGVFLHPQSISAVDISADGRWVGITTMAFRHDRNFWLLGEGGKVQWGRYVQPWAPFQAALLSPPRSPGQESGVRGAFGVGLAYSRFTDPSPTVALFQGEKSTETALVDNLWDMGWLRYGHGDWRTGWPASLIGDFLRMRTGEDEFQIGASAGQQLELCGGSARPIRNLAGPNLHPVHANDRASAALHLYGLLPRRCLAHGA